MVKDHLKKNSKFYADSSNKNLNKKKAFNNKNNKGSESKGFDFKRSHG